MNNTVGIKFAPGHQPSFGGKPDLYSVNTAEARDESGSGKKSESTDRVSITREAYELRREYTEEKEDLRLNYQQERQELKREYQQEKKRLEQEYERKKEALGINVYI